ncbi:Protein AHC1 [Candida tropicalis]
MGDNTEYQSIEDQKLEESSFSVSTNPQASSELDDNSGQSTEANSEESLSQEDIILNRLKDIPHDKLKEIITNQLDLEIQLKHRELNLNDHEIGKIESQMLILRKFYETSNDTKLDNEPNDFTVKYFNLLNKSFDSTYNNLKQIPEAQVHQNLLLQNQQLQNQTPSFSSKYLDDSSGHVSLGGGISQQPGHSYRTRSTTSSLRPSATSIALATVGGRNPGLGCLYRRTDGVVVRLTCPICQRNNFSSAQGFLNHSRIAHSKEFTSQDAAALKCGEILPEIKQDPTGEASIKQLIEKGVDPSKNLNAAEYLFGTVSACPATPGATTTTTTTTTTTSCTPKTEGSPKFDHEEQELQQETPAHSPIEQSNELMKKLVKEGKMKKEEYEKLLKETKEPVSNSHLFDDEVEVDESEESGLSTNPSFSNLTSLNDKRRRVSRGGINISISKDTEESESEPEPIEKKQKRK